MGGKYEGMAVEMTDAEDEGEIRGLGEEAGRMMAVGNFAKSWVKVDRVMRFFV
jgi:hypothetical protein